MKSLCTATTLIIGLAALPISTQAADGAALYKKHCKKCHSMEAGKHGLGPSLAGIFGKQAGTTDFKKYKALKGSDIVWDDNNVSAYIENPKKFLNKKTTMVVKVKKAADRQAIIDYMKSQ